ncbi:hypothetical protein [Paenibacillus polymyxa]|uniref:hypothetical protein n=1 Tax=Paenibacillus polymyxa TaxID=1406 RepID=UPI0025B6D23C|nr:hypothetical protein [Paenibacillus polymyxa]MDN4090956.1 hypothetical protein [Paenibacillus polymyxa]
MKQKLTAYDIDALSAGYQELLANDLECSIDQLLEKVTVGRLIEVIRSYHQLEIYNVSPLWCLRLFDLSTSANDQPFCLYEDAQEELLLVLYLALGWIYERRHEESH